MGMVLRSDEGVLYCHGYKIGDELKLTCTQAKPKEEHVEKLKQSLKSPEIFDLLKADEHLAFVYCASFMHYADEKYNLIRHRDDVYAFMDYCLKVLGHPGRKDRQVPERIKEFIDHHIRDYLPIYLEHHEIK